MSNTASTITSLRPAASFPSEPSRNALILVLSNAPPGNRRRAAKHTRSCAPPSFGAHLSRGPACGELILNWASEIAPGLASYSKKRVKMREILEKLAEMAALSQNETRLQK